MTDRATWPTADTRLVALLGWPARYSLSPAIQNPAFAACGVDAAYVVMPCGEDALATVVRALALTGALGANVTVPHKTAVVASCDALSVEAELVGAVNTLAFDEGRIVGDNTDAAGLVDDWASLILGAHDLAVLLGTGGAARAAAVAAARCGVRLCVVGRRGEAAESVAELASAAGAREVQARIVTDADVADVVKDARLVVNATPLGSAGEPLPEPFMRLGPGQVAYDLVYDPPRTPFVDAALAVGAEAHNGIGMLVAQAARSFTRWTGIDAPVEVMSAAASRALADRREEP